MSFISGRVHVVVLKLSMCKMSANLSAVFMA